MSDYLLSVVIGTYNRIDVIKKCINSILCNDNIKIKIYITDAGSSDGTVNYLHEIESDDIIVTYHQHKLGQARAYNEIFEKIVTPYVCWMSDDNVVVNSGLETAVNILERNKHIGMVGLKVKDVQGPFSSEPYIGGISEAGILNVNQGVLRTKLLQELGGFSEEFMDYGIDPDLTAKVLYSGCGIVYTKKISILHFRNWGDDDALVCQYEKQDKYKELYRRKYVNSGNSLSINGYCRQIMLAVVRIMVLTAKLANGKKKPSWIRNAYNIASCKYVSWLDPVYSIGKDYHLLQRCVKSINP